MRSQQKKPITKFLVCVSIFILFLIVTDILLSFSLYKKETERLKTTSVNNRLHNKISTMDYMLYSADRVFDYFYEDISSNDLNINKVNTNIFNLLDIYIYDKDAKSSDRAIDINIENMKGKINNDKDKSIFLYKNSSSDFPIVVITKPIENKALVAVFYMPYTTEFFNLLSNFEKDENLNTFIVYGNYNILPFHKLPDDFTTITNAYIQGDTSGDCKFYSMDSSSYKYKYVYHTDGPNSKSDNSFFMIIILSAILNVVFSIVFISIYIHYKTSKIESTTDPLTDIYNRRHLLSMINNYSKKKYYPLAFIVLDVDYLKFINDTFGHTKGDDKLKKVADILKSVFRESDIVARIGGDEFAVLLPRTPSNVVKHLAERIKEYVDDNNKRNTDELPISLTTGFYVAEHVLENTEKLFLEADKDMYRNKNESHKKYLEYLTKWCKEHNIPPPNYK